LVEIIALILCAGILIYREICFSKERKEWNAERSKLLDRIQAGSLMEFKSQQRADAPRTKKEHNEKPVYL